MAHDTHRMAHAVALAFHSPEALPSLLPEQPLSSEGFVDDRWWKD